MKERSYGVDGEGEEIVFFKDKRRKKKLKILMVTYTLHWAVRSDWS